MAEPSPSVREDMPWGACPLPTDPPPPELAREVRRHLGTVPIWAGVLAPAPWVVRCNIGLLGAPLAHLPSRLWELATLVVSQDNSCRYCFGTQRTLLRILGYREAEIDRLAHDLDRADVSPIERAALGFARRVSRAQPRPGAADRTALVDGGFPAAAVPELVFAAGAVVYANRLSTLVAMPPESFELAAEHPLGRLLMPLVSRLVRRRFAHPRGRPMPAPAATGGVGDAVVAALGEVPAAAALREAIDAAFASSILPRRTKLLCWGVVARALGCPANEREAVDALWREGVAPVEVAGVLAHLGGPGVDAREAQLLALARESVHYQVPVIQERLRAAATTLGADETVELVGFLALANGAVRIGAMLDAC
ncbi:MAG: carboxymuconolactone decarboxylase family protein [bacterium]|nr:carboxymuconolactone decarboxylase family protein [bacterium]